MATEGHSEDIGSIIIHHVSNSDVLVPLQLFGMDISITKHVIMIWLAGALVMTAFLLGTRRYRREENPIPSGFTNFLEFIVDFVHNQMVVPNVGREHAIRWTPLILAFFTLIVTANLLGMVPFFDLIPGGGTATSNLNVTAALATITFMSIIVAGSMVHGVVGHWKNMAPHGIAWPVLFILIPIEILGMFVRPFALTMRLAANMTAGHIAMLAILAPIFIMANAWVGIGSVTLNVGISFLEIVVALVQAYVFSLLSAVFIGGAINPEH
ncbi:MAG: F0F1 ATP synthase subunit A [Candidatus Marinimicrobia bacterium]|nr:F0F1 ATP synthase subunit A [Candidatus Neomarinimicrobiota bacterium]